LNIKLFVQRKEAAMRNHQVNSAEVKFGILQQSGQTTIMILRLPEVMAMVGLGKSEIYKRISENGFPAQVRLGDRSVGWLLHEVQQWLHEQVQKSRSESAQKEVE
jgi:prophage regulatory protein